MPKNYLLILRSCMPESQSDFSTLLQRHKVAFRTMPLAPGSAAENAGGLTEQVYFVKADFWSLSQLKKTIEAGIRYDELLLFEYIDW